MTENLERIILERKRMAVERGFYMKANLIAESFGISGGATSDERLYNAIVFEDKKLEIGRKGRFVLITTPWDEIVYEGSGPHMKDVRGYIPERYSFLHEWERIFEELYLEIKLREQKRIKEAAPKVTRKKVETIYHFSIIDKDVDLKERFGLEET